MRISSLRFINRCAAAYIIIFCFVPPIQVDDFYRMLAIGASAMWLLSALTIHPGFIDFKVRNFLIISSLFIFLMFVWRLNVDSFGVSFSRSIQSIIIVLVALISMYSLKNDIQFVNIMITIMLILICFYCITTIQGTIENPYAARIANSEWLDNRFEQNKNVGLYGYVYMCVFLVPLLLYKILNKLKINPYADFLTYVALVLILVMVALAGYMVAILCTVVGIIMIALRRQPISIRIVIMIVFGFLFGLFYQQIMSGFITFITSIIGDNPVYGNKLSGFLALYGEGNLEDSSWYGRFTNYAASFRNITQYPIVGCYLFGERGGGGHSEVLDAFGRYGWVTAWLYLTVLWKYPRKVFPYGPKKHSLYTVILIMSIIFGVLDPYSQEMCLPWFFVMPYIIYLETKMKLKNLEYKNIGERI